MKNKKNEPKAKVKIGKLHKETVQNLSDQAAGEVKGGAGKLVTQIGCAPGSRAC